MIYKCLNYFSLLVTDLCIKIFNITSTIFRSRSNKSGWCQVPRIPSFTQSYKVQRESHMFLTFVKTEGKKKFIHVIGFGRRGKEKCEKDNYKKLFYYFILINSNLIFNYENINVISQNI